MVMQVSHGAIQFMVYEELKAAAMRAGRGHLVSGQGDKMHALSSIDISLIGAASKLVASVATYPTQVGTFIWVIQHCQSLFACTLLSELLSYTIFAVLH